MRVNKGRQSERDYSESPEQPRLLQCHDGQKDRFPIHAGCNSSINAREVQLKLETYTSECYGKIMQEDED